MEWSKAHSLCICLQERILSLIIWRSTGKPACAAVRFMASGTFKIALLDLTGENRNAGGTLHCDRLLSVWLGSLKAANALMSKKERDAKAQIRKERERERKDLLRDSSLRRLGY